MATSPYRILPAAAHEGESFRVRLQPARRCRLLAASKYAYPHGLNSAKGWEEWVVPMAPMNGKARKATVALPRASMDTARRGAIVNVKILHVWIA